MTILDTLKSMPSEKLAPLMLAIAVVLGFFGLLGVLAFHAVPQANHDAMMLLLGGLGTAFGAIVQFYFGSSASSKAKDDTIKAISATVDK